MSRSQRTRLSRRHRGRPRNKALLGVMVVLIAIGIAGLSAVGYVVSVAASAPSLDSLKPRDPGSNSEVLAADGTRLGFIKAAARIYFGKRLGQLRLREAALLAGLPQAPSSYSPLRNPQAALTRRNDVL